MVAIHIIDQGSVPGSKDPEYAQILYYILEVAGVVSAALLLTRYTRLGGCCRWEWPRGRYWVTCCLVDQVRRAIPTTSATGPNHSAY